jgi:nicotinamidase-related amidase
MVARLEETAQAFRQAGNPVYWTRHAHLPGEPARTMSAWWKDLLREGDPLAQLDPRFEIGPLDLVLGKQTYNGFDGTALTTVLEERGCDTLVIGGVMTHLCVATTAREAFCRNFHVNVLLDGTAAPDELLHLSALRTLAHGVARVISCAEARGALPETSNE